VNLLEHIKVAMADQSSAIHIDEIALLLEQKSPRFCQGITNLPDRISQVLAVDVKKKGPAASFSKVKNKTGGYKRGIYKLKRKQAAQTKPSATPSVTTQFTGRAGENAVISELLFYGFNACAMSVDDGIDVIASKDNKYFHVQVKTSNSSESRFFNATIKSSSFKAKNTFQMFYIFVLRQNDKNRYFNDYLILPSNQIWQLIETGVVKDSPTLSIRIQRDKGGLYILNKKQDVTNSINKFSQIV
jgi:hypothetical protein